MAANIKTLKEDNGDITYPQTKAGAVYTDEGSDVQTVLDDCTRFEEVAATSSLTPLVTSSMIDWSTIRPTVSTESTTATGWFAPTWYKRVFPDGRIIYTCFCTSILTNFPAAAWGSSGAVNLPVTYDASKMALTATVGSRDAAISISARTNNGATQLVFPWVNNYSGAVNTYIDITVRLEVFPN